MTIKYQPASTCDRHDIILLLEEIFGTALELSYAEINDCIRHFSPKLSVLVFDDDKLVGCYLLAQAEPFYEEIKNIKTLYRVFAPLRKYSRGLQGLFLALKEEYRGRGIGEKLILHPSTLGYDYIFGRHSNTLNNREQWLQRRFLLAEFDEYFITYQFFKN